MGSLVVVSAVPVEVAVFRLGAGGRLSGKKTARTDETGSAVFASLAPGAYRIVAEAPEHDPFTEDVKVVAGRPLTVAAALRPRFGVLLVAGVDSAAQVLVDGREPTASEVLDRSRNQLRVKASLGTHEVRVEREGAEPFAAKVDVEAGKEQSVAAVLAPKRTRFDVEAPPGAVVYLDSTPAGPAPSTGLLALNGVEPGVEHEVRVELEDHAPFTARARAAAGAVERVRAVLEPLPTSGPFEDGFRSGLALWEAPASWTAHTAEGFVEVRGRNQAGIARGLRYRDCEVHLDVKLDDPAGAGWIVRARDARNGYLFWLMGPAAPFPNSLCLYVLRDGQFDPKQPAVAAQAVDSALSVGGYYHVRIAIEGAAITHYLTPADTAEEIKIGYFQDPKAAFKSGGVGLVAVGAGAFRVASVIVKSEVRSQKSEVGPSDRDR